MCLFAKARPEVCVVCGFLEAWIRSTTEAEMAQHNPEVSLLIPACSHALASVKTGRSKGWVSRFMSTISHRENGLKTWEKTSDPVCYVEATWTWRMLVVLMVWNNVRNASHGVTARCIIQHSFESHSISVFFLLSLSIFSIHLANLCLCSVSALC